MLVVLASLGVIFVFGFTYITVQELKLKLVENSIESASFNQTASILEKGTSVRTIDLKNYLLFTGMKRKRLFFQSNFLSSSGPRTSIDQSEVELPKTMINECQKFRCLQFKKSFAEIPSNIWKALLGTEDFRFLEHRGIDFISIARAIVVDIIAMKFVQGGSTLTQQLVKNLFLTNEKKISRKIKEVIYALYIENILTKEKIIELYLNEVFWGTYQGVYLKGFEAASIAYFNKNSHELSDWQATILVSLLKGPNFYRPTNIDRIKDRTIAVYKRLRKLKLVSAQLDNKWSESQWESWSLSYQERSKDQTLYIFFLVSKNSEQNLEGFEKFVFSRVVLERTNQLKEVLVDTDFAVKAIISDKQCNNYDCEKVFSFYSKFQREKRIAITEERHQVGSLLKPIVYDSFINLGKDYDELVSTSPITLQLKSGPWSPKDYSKAKTNSISIKEALQKSKNIPLIRVANDIGFEKLESVLKERIKNLKSPLAEYPAQLLGAIELSLEEVLEIYSKFIAEKCDLLKSDRVSFDHSVLSFMSIAKETTISNLARGAIKEALIFGKTGTSNNGLDNWYYAFDGTNNYIIWFGIESDRNNLDLRLTGASTSFIILQNYLLDRGKQLSEVYCH